MCQFTPSRLLYKIPTFTQQISGSIFKFFTLIPICYKMIKLQFKEPSINFSLSWFRKKKKRAFRSAGQVRGRTGWGWGGEAITGTSLARDALHKGKTKVKWQSTLKQPTRNSTKTLQSNPLNLSFRVKISPAISLLWQGLRLQDCADAVLQVITKKKRERKRKASLSPSVF